ncbi:MAG: BRO family protein [Hyphomicrobiales bacterium]|nr:BRO family protein [Hyphomicrobiales bacterium]
MTLIDDQPWFVAKDVCVILGLMKSAGTSPALRSLDISERRREDRISLLSKQVAVGSLFGKDEPSLNLISESGLYKLVMRSDKPQAKEFQNWVTKVVLPAIRKDGGYVLGEEKLGSGDSASTLPNRGRRN